MSTAFSVGVVISGIEYRVRYAVWNDDIPPMVSRLRWPICSDITEEEPYSGRFVLQSGVPEVEEFVRKVQK